MSAPDPRLAARTYGVAPFHVVALSEVAYSLMAQGREVIMMLPGEPDFGTPQPVVDAVSESLQNGRVRYTQSFGIPSLRLKIAEYYTARFGVTVPIERIAVTTGASSALLLALAATLDKDQQLLLSDPGYPCNRHFARIYEGRSVNVPVGPETNYQLSAELIDHHWTADTGGALIATPSNPTGTIVPPDELARIAVTVAGHGGTLIVDEIYAELVYDSDPKTILSYTHDAFVINSFSKTFGMTGWRLGWMIVPEWAVAAVTRLAANMYISAPEISQHAGAACFAPEVWAIVAQRKAELRARRDLLVAGLRELGFGVPVVPEGAFYVYADCSAFTDNSYDWCVRLLNEEFVGVTPGIDFGKNRAREHVRFSYTCSQKQITEALHRIARFLNR